MKKTLIPFIVIVLALAACSSTGTAEEMSTTEVGAAMTNLATTADSLVEDLRSSDAGAELNDVMSVLATNTTTVALAATAGDVSPQDVDRLTSSLGQLRDRVDAVRDRLDPALVDRLDSFRTELQSLIDRLSG